MPFCTECGARHDDSATVCPNCGEPIFAPPDEEIDDVLASLDELDAPGHPTTARPAAPEPSAGYLEQIQEVRGAIAAQSNALQEVGELTWSNPTAAQIRDELTVALAQLRELTPPPELGDAHEDFVQGAEHLVHGFVALVEAINKPNADAEVEAAQQEIAQATERFRGGADALNDYLAAHEPPGDASLDEAEPPADELDLPEELLRPIVPEEDAEPLLDDAWGAAAPPPAASPVASSATAHQPPRPAPPASGYPAPGTVPPEAHPTQGSPGVGATEAASGAWPTLGDPGTDSLLLEIEGGWMRGRPAVHEAIERAVRGAVVDALRGALQTRRRIEEEARATLQRIASERNRLLDEVESLRRETLQLQAEAAELRRTLNELERERQGAHDRRQQVFQDAEAHRAQLLGEIEQLGGQLDAMRRNIVGLLNMSAQATGELGQAAPPPRPPLTPVAPSSFGDAESSPEVASDGTTQVRINGVQGVARNLQLQKAIRALDGVEVEGQPQFRNGVLVLNLRHDPSMDLMGALLELPTGGLQFEGMPEPGVIEFQAA